MATCLVEGRRLAVVGRAVLGTGLSLLFCLALFVAPALAYGGPLPPDARLVGMGWTYVGVLDLPNPACANPAAFGFGVDGISGLVGIGIGGSTADGGTLFAGVRDVDRGIGAGGLSIAYRRPAGAEPAVMHLGYGIGKKLGDRYALGLGIGYARIADSTVQTLTTDAGLALKFGAFSAGVMASGITASRFGDGNTMETDFVPEVSFGLALRPLKPITLAVDAHDVFGRDSTRNPWYSGGVEVWIRDRFALRCGAIASPKTEGVEMSYTGGLGFRAGKVDFGYALTWEAGAASNHCVTIGAKF
ncbi:MAG: hypothetical protein VB144_13205 [Clostridia bacterium]|nr:hypothetical protein [Clostridia bacterium]